MQRERTVYDKSIPRIGLEFVFRLHWQALRFYTFARDGHPICQHYHWFLSRICRLDKSGQKPKYFEGITRHSRRSPGTETMVEDCNFDPLHIGFVIHQHKR